MADEGHMRGIKFDPTINLGHVVTLGTSLLMIGWAWANLDGRTTNNAKATEENRAALALKADKETVGKGEVELSRRITEQQGIYNQTQLRTAEDIREIKNLIRDGFRDIDAKLDRKVDKPGR